jgi:hypothetical protein
LRLQRVDVIKIDVKGAGAGVIKGGLNTIRNFKPTIFLRCITTTNAQPLCDS